MHGIVRQRGIFPLGLTLILTPFPISLSESINRGLVCARNRLVGQVVKVSASRAEDPGFESRL